MPKKDKAQKADETLGTQSVLLTETLTKEYLCKATGNALLRIRVDGRTTSFNVQNDGGSGCPVTVAFGAIGVDRRVVEVPPNSEIDVIQHESEAKFIGIKRVGSGTATEAYVHVTAVTDRTAN